MNRVTTVGQHLHLKLACSSTEQEHYLSFIRAEIRNKKIQNDKAKFKQFSTDVKNITKLSVPYYRSELDQNNDSFSQLYQYSCNKMQK